MYHYCIRHDTRKIEITEVWEFSHCEETGISPEVLA